MAADPMKIARNRRLALTASAAVALAGSLAAGAATAGQTQYYYDTVGRLLGATQAVGAYRTSQVDDADNITYLKVNQTTPPTGSVMYPGNVLLGGQAMYNNCFSVVVQTDGSLALWKSSATNAYWSTNTAPNQTGYLTLATSGDLQLLGPDNRIIWRSNTTGHPNAYLNMQPDGNLVLYQGSTAYWASGTSGQSC